MRLQPQQAVTTFSQVVQPPRERAARDGRRSDHGSGRSLPQYWQVNAASQEDVEPGEGRPARHGDVRFQRDDTGQPYRRRRGCARPCRNGRRIARGRDKPPSSGFLRPDGQGKRSMADRRRRAPGQLWRTSDNRSPSSLPSQLARSFVAPRAGGRKGSLAGWRRKSLARRDQLFAGDRQKPPPIAVQPAGLRHLTSSGQPEVGRHRRAPASRKGRYRGR